MKEFWKGYWHFTKIFDKWLLIILGLCVHMSIWTDLGWNGWDLEKCLHDIIRRLLPKCLYERLGVEEGEEA